MTFAFDNSGDWQYVDGTVAVTLEQESVTKDTSGGVLQSWRQVATCTGDLQPASGAVKKRFEALGLVVAYTIFLSADVGQIAAGTGLPIQACRFRIGTRSFQTVEGGYEAGYGNLTGWPATAHVQEVPASP